MSIIASNVTRAYFDRGAGQGQGLGKEEEALLIKLSRTSRIISECGNRGMIPDKLPLPDATSSTSSI